MTTKTTLLPTLEFGRVAVKKISSAKERVYLMSMTLHVDDEISSAIIDSIIEASHRGIKVTVTADSFTYTEPKDFKLSTLITHPIRARKSLKVGSTLRDNGAGFRWLGRNSNIGFAGRTHTKWLVIDNTVYSFGGINIDGRSFTNTDYMLERNDKKLADWIIKQHEDIIKADRAGRAMRNRKYSLDDKTTVFLDGGLPGSSIIYSRACKLALPASSSIIVSQYCPSGKLARIINKKPYTLFFNSVKNANSLNRFMIATGKLTTNLLNSYTKKNYLHAKLAIFTMHDGSKVALSGSHNLSYSGVLFGTREIAIETTDESIIAQLESFIDTKVIR